MPGMPGVNVVFMGNLLYPEGLAETKRFQHFIDGVMAGEGNSAHILLLRQSHPGRDDSRLDGEKLGVSYQTIGRDIRAGIGLPIAALRYLLAGCRFLRRARRTGVRNVLFVYGEPNLENVLFVIRARLLGYRVVVDIVEDLYFVTDAAPLLSRLKGWSVKWATDHMHWFADGIVVISSYLRKKMERIVGGRVPVELIPVSVDLDRIVQSRAPFHHPVRMLYAGSFGDKDGIENLIAAFEQVAATWPGMEFLMTGRGSPERMAAVQERIDLSPLADRIRYLGYLSDDEYFRVISDCDIPCVVRVPSEFADRGFPFKLGEFLATGRPVVTALVSDVGLYLTDRVNAMLVQPGSVQAIAAAMDYLLANETRALALGEAGRAVAAEHFSAHSGGQRLLQLIERLGPP
jgi:glycosyltransferase involved in cell wall biosynthesis